MTVPTHNLYDFVYQVTEKRHWLVYFWPWGERDLSCGKWYHGNFEIITDPVRGIDYKDLVASKFFSWNTIKENTFLVRHLQSVLFCHDQEPLNWDHYLDSSPFQQTLINLKKNDTGFEYLEKHMRLNVLHNWQQHWILLHSELNSPELEKYQRNGYIGAYWWSHAVIARDWYRYAEHDPALRPWPAQKTFLVYCRDTTGSRTYRQDFLNMLDRNLKSHCQIGSVSGRLATADASAEYDVVDFNTTGISVVLETVFDQRIHLTEKILRAIACGHPFILAAGPGSLKLLRHYGFKTFAPWINENYDQEMDPVKRLEMIVKEMQRITTNSESIITQCREIAQYNQKRFFSADFLSQVQQELSTNVRTAYENTLDCLDPTEWLKERRLKRKDKSLLPDGPVQKELLKLARWARLNNGSFKQYQCHEHGLDDKSGANGNDV